MRAYPSRLIAGSTASHGSGVSEDMVSSISIAPIEVDPNSPCADLVTGVRSPLLKTGVPPSFSLSGPTMSRPRRMASSRPI
jgi:hypothetical protein